MSNDPTPKFNNKYIEFFELKKKYQGIEPYKLNFKEGINIIVGENGSGKSTMLKLILGEKNSDLFLVKLIKSGERVSYRFFDTEKDNPRISSRKFEQSPALTLHSHFVSHGEAMLPIIKWCKNAANMIIFIDEPDAGISLRNQKTVFQVLKKAVAQGCQVIVTTHSYVLIKSVKTVFNLDTGQWVSSDDYLERVLGKTWIAKKKLYVRKKDTYGSKKVTVTGV